MSEAMSVTQHAADPPRSKAKRKRRRHTDRQELPLVRLVVESLDQEGRGVAHVEGKVVFAEGGLIGEDVSVRILRSKKSYAIGEVVTIHRESSSRVVPACSHFGVCGGCAMQHLDAAAQVAIKQRVLEDSLLHIGRVRPEIVWRPIHGPAWGYRNRARFGVRQVIAKGGVLVGFHERNSSYIADMRECHVVPPEISLLLTPLREMINRLTIANRIPQIEVAIGGTVTALVFRHLESFSTADREILRAFGELHAVQIWVQPDGPQTVARLDAGSVLHRDPLVQIGRSEELAYDLPEFGVHMPFLPTDFTQVNPHINEILVSRAVALLDPLPTDRVADLFCGLGNFSLPLATRARWVVGIEGSDTLVQRACANAVLNGLSHKVNFLTANLFEITVEQWRALEPFDKVLIDPPRDGALELCKVLSLAPNAPRRVVYVSCNPGTLARDAEILTIQGGYRLSGAGVVNMFPHTAHVESIAMFERT